MKDSRFIVILGWMLTRLSLSGNDLLLYAYIYGYSQDSMGGYWGSLANTAEALNLSKRTVSDIFARLLDKGLLAKREMTLNGVKRCLYSAVVPAEESEEPEAPPSRPSSPPVPPQDKKKGSRPTYEEVEEYCRQRGNKVNARRFFDFYTANGWVQGRSGKPIKDWRAAVRTWETTDTTKFYGEGTDKQGKERIIEERRSGYLAEAAALDARYIAAKSRKNDTDDLFDAVQPSGG